MKGACPASALADPGTIGPDGETEPIGSAPGCRPVEEPDVADDEDDDDADDVGDEREAAGEDPNPNAHATPAAAAAGEDR